jgi:hypothetical protein
MRFIAALNPYPALSHGPEIVAERRVEIGRVAVEDSLTASFLNFGDMIATSRIWGWSRKQAFLMAAQFAGQRHHGEQGSKTFFRFGEARAMNHGDPPRPIRIPLQCSAEFANEPKLLPVFVTVLRVAPRETPRPRLCRTLTSCRGSPKQIAVP